MSDDAWHARIRALAVQTLSDPSAEPAERAGARAHLVAAQADISRLTAAERALLRDLLGALHGLDASGRPDARSTAERRVAAEAAERPRAMTVADHLAAIAVLDPDGSEVRRVLATVE